MKLACSVTGLRQAGKAELAFQNRLKSAPVTHGAHHTAFTDEELVIGSDVVSAYDHRVALSIDPEAMPHRCGNPGGRSPPVDAPILPIARPIVHSPASAPVHLLLSGFRRGLHLSKAWNRDEKDSHGYRELRTHIFHLLIRGQSRAG